MARTMMRVLALGFSCCYRAMQISRRQLPLASTSREKKTQTTHAFLTPSAIRDWNWSSVDIICSSYLDAAVLPRVAEEDPGGCHENLARLHAHRLTRLEKLDAHAAVPVLARENAPQRHVRADPPHTRPVRPREVHLHGERQAGEAPASHPLDTRAEAPEQPHRRRRHHDLRRPVRAFRERELEELVALRGGLDLHAEHAALELRAPPVPRLVLPVGHLRRDDVREERRRRVAKRVSHHRHVLRFVTYKILPFLLVPLATRPAVHAACAQPFARVPPRAAPPRLAAYVVRHDQPELYQHPKQRVPLRLARVFPPPEVRLQLLAQYLVVHEPLDHSAHPRLLVPSKLRESGHHPVRAGVLGRRAGPGARERLVERSERVVVDEGPH
mmetsp:Transcript_1519/g.3481  ORF Transcript_1519/g.3481 Transcript_1519/m.3481 type:complete len:385 (+) Transcript_1519:1230-2384(+)